MSLTVALLIFAFAFVTFLSSRMEMDVTNILVTILSAGRFAITLIILQHFFNYVQHILLVICYLIKDPHPAQANPRQVAGFNRPEGHEMDRSSNDDENNGFMGGPALASEDEDDDYAGSLKIH